MPTTDPPIDPTGTAGPYELLEELGNSSSPVIFGLRSGLRRSGSGLTLPSLEVRLPPVESGEDGEDDRRHGHQDGEDPEELG